MNNKTPHSKLQTPRQLDNTVTTPGLRATLPRPACHLLELFLGSANANMNIKAFLFARESLTLGVFSNAGTAFWRLVLGFSSSVVFSQLLVVEYDEKLAGDQPLHPSTPAETGPLSCLWPRLPERCVFPRLR